VVDSESEIAMPEQFIKPWRVHIVQRCLMTLRNSFICLSTCGAMWLSMHGEVVVNEALSLQGFVDATVSQIDRKGAGHNQSEPDRDFDLAQMELSLLLDVDAVFAQVDLNYLGASDQFELEQAYFSRDTAHGASLTVGRYASMIGFEAFEPTGLYQSSRAYTSGAHAAMSDFSVIPDYANGLKYTLEQGPYFYGLSVQDEVFGDRWQASPAMNAPAYGIEVAFSMIVADGLFWFCGGSYESTDLPDLGDSHLLNTYAVYEFGAWLFAAEYNFGKSGSGRFALAQMLGATEETEKVSQGLVMANFAHSEVTSFTGRFSFVDHKISGMSALSGRKYSLAMQHELSDHLRFTTELGYFDGTLEAAAGGQREADLSVAYLTLEWLFTF